MTGRARAHLHLRMTVAPLNGKTMKQLEALSGVAYPTLARQMNGCQANGKCGQLDEKGRPYARIQGDLVAGLAEGLNVSLDSIAYRVNADGQDTRRAEPAVKKEKGHDTPTSKGKKAKPAKPAAATPPEEPKTEKPPVKTLPEGPKSKKSPEIDKGAWFAKRKKDHEPVNGVSRSDWHAWEARRMLYSGKPMTMKRAVEIAGHVVEAEDRWLWDEMARMNRAEEVVERLMSGKRFKPLK